MAQEEVDDVHNNIIPGRKVDAAEGILAEGRATKQDQQSEFLNLN